jgi:hypothetical protein
LFFQKFDCKDSFSCGHCLAPPYAIIVKEIVTKIHGSIGGKTGVIFALAEK